MQVPRGGFDLAITCDVAALNATSGQVTWQTLRSCFSGFGGGVAAYAHGQVFSISNGTIRSAATGAFLQPLLRAPVAVTSKWAYATVNGQNSGRVVAADLRTGNFAWTYTAKNDVFAVPPIAVNGMVFALASEQPFANRAKLFVLDGTTGIVLRTLFPKTSNAGFFFSGPTVGMAAGEGTLVVSSGSRVVAYGP